MRLGPSQQPFWSEMLGTSPTHDSQAHNMHFLGESLKAVEGKQPSCEAVAEGRSTWCLPDFLCHFLRDVFQGLGQRWTGAPVEYFLRRRNGKSCDEINKIFLRLPLVVVAVIVAAAVLYLLLLVFWGRASDGLGLGAPA